MPATEETPQKKSWYTDPAWWGVIVVGLGVIVALVALIVKLVDDDPDVAAATEPFPAPSTDPALPDPASIDPDAVPAAYRDVVEELQELYLLGRYEQALVLGGVELVDTGAVSELLPDEQLTVWHYLGNSAFEIGSLDLASLWLGFAAEVGGVDNTAAVAAARVSGSVVEAERGDVELADVLLDDAADIYGRLEDESGLALIALNRCALRLGEATTVEFARGSCNEALDEARRLGLLRIEVSALVNLGVLALEEGETELALQLFNDALTRAEEADFTRSTIAALNGRGLARRILHLFPEARDDFQRAIELSRDVPNRLDEARSLNNAALVFADCGDTAHVQELLEAAEELARGTGAQPVVDAIASNLDRMFDAEPPEEIPDEQCDDLFEIVLDEA